MRAITIIGCLLTLLVCSCHTNNLTHVRVHDAYKTEDDFQDMKVTVVNLSDAVTRVYFSVETAGLLYVKEAYRKNFMASYDVHYDCGLIESPKIIHDSLTLHKSDTLHYIDRKAIVDSFDVRLGVAGKFVIQIRVVDRNNRSERMAYLSLDNTNVMNRQNFLARDAEGDVLFNPWMNNPASTFTLTTRMTNTPRLFVRYYKHEYPIALPPFVEGKAQSFSFKPDSVFFIELSEGRSGPLAFLTRGIYHIQSDTTIADGFTFFSYYKGFPEVANASHMLFPLRYICSKSEFNDMVMMKNRKQAVDDFWLDAAGNPDRAKELIRKFYNRVAAANLYFSSYHEGWKTDRGLIYLIYGPPSIVYRNPNSETWIYGENRDILSMTLNFNRVNNAFTDNDYELNRSQEYKETWYAALAGWKN